MNSFEIRYAHIFNENLGHRTFYTVGLMKKAHYCTMFAALPHSTLNYTLLMNDTLNIA